MCLGGHLSSGGEAEGGRWMFPDTVQRGGGLPVFLGRQETPRYSNIAGWVPAGIYEQDVSGTEPFSSDTHHPVFG